MAALFIVTDRCRARYPGAVAGVLAMSGVANPERHPALDMAKDALEAEVRERFHDRADVRAVRRLRPYTDYFKRFDKTYHVQLQLESVALKGKPIPREAALVEAMFVAELKNLLLTAGHDLDAVRAPVRLDIASGDERYVLLNEREQQPKAGDMMMVDAEGIISSVLYGPDRRTRIQPDTRRVLFTVYAPPGVGEQAVSEHLRDLQATVRLITPNAETESLGVFGM